jgi:hypothetical protein
VIRERVTAAARDYEDVRKSMPSSDVRTRRMEVIASTMRTMAPSTYSLLAMLAGSDSPGERLAAVVALQVLPHPEYLMWLSERMAIEKPFIGYHAAIALLAAARTLSDSDLDQVAKAVAHMRATSKIPEHSDRAEALHSAEEALQRRGVGVLMKS